ncbi:DUF6653 family protein [Wenxinia saemankumensis]
MTMSDATWARHANPWSGWSRLSILPLLALAGWSRLWLGWGASIPAGAVLAWAWLNPRLFPAPAGIDAWMSKGVLGERIWLSRRDDPIPAHHAPVLRVLTIVVLAGTALLLAGILLLDPVLTLTGLSVAMLGKLWFLDRMVWIFTEADHTEWPLSPGAGPSGARDRRAG